MRKVGAFLRYTKALGEQAPDAWMGVDWRELAESEPYGAGLCGEASKDLAAYLGWRGTLASPLWLQVGAGIAAHYPTQDSWEAAGHCVCVASTGRRGGVWVVDLTARQFGEHLPFPWIWPYPDGRWLIEAVHSRRGST